MLRYPAVVHTEGDSFWIEFPDFPATYTYGDIKTDDPAEFAANCLADSLLFLMKEGKPIPEPSRAADASLLISPHYTERGLRAGKLAGQAAKKRDRRAGEEGKQRIYYGTN